MTTLIDLSSIEVELNFEQAQEVAKKFLIECFKIEEAFGDDIELKKAIKLVLKECVPLEEWQELDKELVVEEDIQA